MNTWIGYIWDDSYIPVSLYLKKCLTKRQVVRSILRLCDFFPVHAPKIAFFGKIQPTKQKSHQPWSKLKSLEVILILLSRIKETAPQVEHPLSLLSILYRAERPDLLLNPAEGVCFTPHNPSLSFLYCNHCEIGFKTLVKSNVFSRKGPRNT